MSQLLVRFLVGGAIVSAFALLGDVLHPKGFAGLFSAAPSVALATLTLTVAGSGPGYAALEARSMIMGAIGGMGFGAVMWKFLPRLGLSAALVLALLSWFAISSLLWYVRKHHPWNRP